LDSGKLKEKGGRPNVWPIIEFSVSHLLLTEIVVRL
jgi:hypothetical protein